MKNEKRGIWGGCGMRGAVIVGLFGLTTLGPTQLIILGLVMYVLTIDPFECMMPYVVNGLKITSDSGLKLAGVGVTLIATLLVVLAVTFPTALWADYNHAANMDRGWDSTTIYNAAEKMVTQLSLSGELKKVEGYGVWGRLAHLKPDSTFLASMGVGFVLLLVISAMRLRYSWWPLHPVAVLVFGSPAIGKFGFSFFLGWMLKVGISRFGGASKYEHFKPMMVGVIVGDLTGAFLIMLVSWIYYAVKGMAGVNWQPW